MSYIRQGQTGTYIDIPGGSVMYVYGDGRRINDYDYGEFAGVLYGLAEQVVGKEVSSKKEAAGDTEKMWLARVRDGLQEYFWSKWTTIAPHLSGNQVYEWREFEYHFQYGYRTLPDDVTLPEWGEMLCQVLDNRLEPALLEPWFHRLAKRHFAAEFEPCCVCGDPVRVDVMPSRDTDPLCGDECFDELLDEKT